MRIALLSDVHGNPIALDAVLADVEGLGGVDGYWVLGDLAAIGPDPIGALERLAGLPNAAFARGNADRHLVEGSGPAPTIDQVRANPALSQRLYEVARSLAWTQGAVTATGWLPWLAALPLELRMTLPDGTHLLGVHASPGCDDEPGVRPDLGEAQLRGMFAGCDADLVCVGHTHWPLDLEVAGVRVVNLGSVSNPKPPDLRASYCLLEADQSGYHVEQRRVEYDHEAVIAAAQEVRHPAAGYITRFMRGQVLPRWTQQQEG